MNEQKISKARLLLNGLGSAAIAALCLLIGIPGLIELASGPSPITVDPDGAGKVWAIQMLCATLGAVALASLIRTVKAWRRAGKQ